MISDYGKVFHFGAHRSISDLLKGVVTVEEKIDGSQFSFRLGDSGNLVFRSRNQILDPANPGMFAAAVAAIQNRKPWILPGHTYRGEFLRAPRHNVLSYGRIPRGHVIIWEVEQNGARLSPTTRSLLAASLDLETVPVFYRGRVSSVDIRKFLSRESVLGGPIEGVVIKDETRSAKIVADLFREIKGGPSVRKTPEDIPRALGKRYAPPARWEKAIQRLRERGELTDSTSDIGALIREIQSDVRNECEEMIKAELFEREWPKVSRATVEGFAEWYRAKLAESVQ